MSIQPLKGIRVLDLSKVLAGPLCGQYLGDLGADVIKVEPPETGDDTRAWLPREQGQSAIFLAVNHNKRSLALDLKQPAGREVVHRLAMEADIVLQGFGAGTATRLGVDSDTLCTLNPRLIYCEISGYGRDGPMGTMPGYDVMLQAFSGMISTMGQPDGDYARASFSPVDIGTGMHALSGILAALLERERTGKGLVLEVTLLDTAIGFMGYQAQNYWCSGTVPKPMGTAHPAMAPYQAFRASDGPLFIGVGNDTQWRRFCAAAGLAGRFAQEELATNAARVANFDRTVQLVQARVEREPVAHWLRVLQQANVPCAPIHKLDQALAHPQVAARQLIEKTFHPLLGEIRHVGMPIRFERQPRSAVRPPPLLGEHDTEILREAGYSAAEIDTLHRSGTIGASPRARE